jgi:hypothetical protein
MCIFKQHKTTKKFAMAVTMIKEQAREIINKLPETATWDDLMHEIYVREAIERGLDDSNSGRTKEVKEIRSKYGLPQIREVLERAWQLTCTKLST